MSPRGRALIAPLAAGTVLVACGGPPSAGDYRSGAEGFIEGGLDGQADAAGVSFAEASCDDPPSTDTGAIFACTASGQDGTAYTFTVTIVGRNRMDLVSEPPLPAAGTTGAPATTVAP